MSADQQGAGMSHSAPLTFEVTHKLTLANPNGLGEALRDAFFDQDPENGKYGCYSTFDLRDDVTELPPDERFYDEGDGWEWHETWTRAFKEIDGQEVVMEYHWDGDGTLRFLLPGSYVLQNTDCKKSGRWEVYGGE